jgi:hypothetical protein
MDNKSLVRSARANVTNIVKRLMLYRDPGCAGDARYICPGCEFERWHFLYFTKLWVCMGVISRHKSLIFDLSSSSVTAND